MHGGLIESSLVLVIKWYRRLSAQHSDEDYIMDYSVGRVFDGRRTSRYQSALMNEAEKIF